MRVVPAPPIFYPSHSHSHSGTVDAAHSHSQSHQSSDSHYRSVLQAKASLDRRFVRAPYAGEVLQVKARVGEYVARVAPAVEDLPVFPNYALQDQYDTMRIVGECSA